MALRLNNLGINRKLLAVSNERLESETGIPVERLNILEGEYRSFLEQPELIAYRPLSYAHSKPLEYFGSLQLLKPGPASVVLDAAGGGGQFAAIVLRSTAARDVISHDPVQIPGSRGGIRYTGGTVESIQEPDESIDCISCHHSLEHFRGGADIAFMSEVFRLLKPGGRACVVPLFVASKYFEIWNTKDSERYDDSAVSLYDPFATFPGWGPYERFARVYDLAAFVKRLLTPLSELGAKIRLFEVLYEGKVAPDISFFRNNHQIAMNRPMRAMVIEKQAAGR
jgi:SAM-dependent methyltransferase